jgi:protein-disulfide isomerase
VVIAAFAVTGTASAQAIRQVTRSAEIAITRDPGPARIGARGPAVTIVEYFDYNCPFCRRITPMLRQVVAAGPRLALIYKDWPVLGPASVYAARCALAARYQGKYLQAHDALLDGPRLTSDAEVQQVLGRAGIDVPRMLSDLARHATAINRVLNRNDDEARALELQGTPGLLIGRTLVPGVVGRTELLRLIAAAREDRGKR